LALLGRRWPGMRLDLLGDGDELILLRAQVVRLGLNDRVGFSGRLRPIEEILPALRAAHLAVLPTRREPSTDYMLPTKLLEYLALGIPALVTPTLTVRRYFGETQPLYLEDPSPEALAEKIAWVRENYDEARRRTAEMQRGFFEQFAWSRHRQVYLDLLDRLGRR
jgi:glycosyltransferase involved in cell wall biosynthesis